MPGITVEKQATKGLKQLAQEYSDLQAEQVVLNRYMPNMNQIDIVGIGNLSKPLFSKDNIFKKFTMLPGTHTVESCTMNAGIISANQEYNNTIDLLNGAIAMNPGFYIEVYNEYFWDDVNYFDKTDPKWTSFTDTPPFFSTIFDNINRISNNKVPTDGNRYSIRLTGIFNFDKVGTWTFTTNSDDSSLLWIGDNAIIGTTLNKSDLNNKGGHGMRIVTSSYVCKEIGEQPIRVMMGNWGGPGDLIIQYKGPGWEENAQAADYKGITYIKNYTKNKKPIFNNVYYSLIGDPAKKQLNCAIYGEYPTNIKDQGYIANQGFLQSSLNSMDTNYLVDNIVEFKEMVVWEIIDPDSKIFQSSSTYNLVNVWSPQASPGSLVVNTPNGVVAMTTPSNRLFISAGLHKMNNPYDLSKAPFEDQNKYVKQYIKNYPDLQAWFDAAVSKGGWNLQRDGYGQWVEHYAVWGLGEGRQYSNTFYAKIETDGNFYIRDGDDNVIWSLIEIPDKTDSVSNAMPHIQRIKYTTFVDNIQKKAIKNEKWVKEINNMSKMTNRYNGDTLFFGETMTNGYNNQKGTQYLIDRSGKYKIQVSDSGNLVYVITKKIKPRTYTDNLKNTYNYTTYDDNSAYLYKVHAPSVMTKTFEEKKDKDGNPVLYNVDTKSKLFTYSSETNNMSYVKYPSYYPPANDTNKDIKTSQENCQTKCTNDNNCMYYYSYTNKGDTYCQITGKDDHITFAASSDPNNTNSALYVKNPNTLFNSLLSDPYNTNNKSIESFTSKKYNISSIPSSLNGKDQIIDPNYRNYLSDLQNSLIGSTSSIKAGEINGASTTTIDDIKDSVSSTKPGSAVAAAAEASKTSVSYTSNSTITSQASKTSRTIGEAFTSFSNSILGSNSNYSTYYKEVKDNREPFKEGIDNVDSFMDSIYDQIPEDMLNVEMRRFIKDVPLNLKSVQTPPKDVTNISALATPSIISYEDNSDKLKPEPTLSPGEMLKKDLFLHCMVPSSEIIPVGSVIQKGRFKMKTPTQTSSSKVQTGQFVNHDHPFAIQDWNRCVNVTRDQINADSNPFNASFLKLKNGYKPPGYGGGKDHNAGITFAFWICPSYSKTWSRVFDFGDEWGSGGHQIVVCPFFDWLVFIVCNFPYSGTWCFVSGINLNDWTHIVWKLNPVGEWDIYANGSKIHHAYSCSAGWNKLPDEHNLSGGGATYPDPTYKLNTCYIGRSNWWWDPFFNGEMSDFRIYDGILSDKEISLLYNTSSTNYNTNRNKLSINRGIDFLCHFKNDTLFVWQWDWICSMGQSISRSADGSTGSVNMWYLWNPQMNNNVLFCDQNGDWVKTWVNHPIKKDTTISHGYCLKLDGNHYVQLFKSRGITLPQIKNNSGGLTISVWIKADAGANKIPSSCPSDYKDEKNACNNNGIYNMWRRIFDFGNGRDQDNIVLGLWKDKLSFWTKDEKGVVSTMGPEWGNEYNNGATLVPIADGKWHHIVWSIYPSSTPNLYKWSVYIDNKYYPIDHNFFGYVSNHNLTKCYIGKSNWGSEGLLIGSISDFRIYSKILNTEEVSELYIIGNMDTNTGNEAFSNRLEGFSNILGGSTLSEISNSSMSYTNYQEGYQTQKPIFPSSGNSDSNQNLITDSNLDYTYNDVVKAAYSIGSATTKYNQKYQMTNTLRTDLSNIIDNYNDVSGILHSDLAKYDFSSNDVFILDPNRLKTTQDVLKDDVQELILRENTIYTLGVVTCATLLIGALLISSKR
jgi:hypothetical protein